MSYKIKLPVFEGPLDLLLYLIKKEEIDIYDIPIAKITDQYLEYLEMLKALDLGIAGEFIVMAATLLHIKSRLLLPQEEKIEEETLGEDPRSELVRRLIEYKKFKEAAGSLADMDKKREWIYSRAGKPDNIEDLPASDEGDEGFEASIFDLITAFAKVVKNVSKEEFYRVLQDEFTVSQKIHDLFHMLVDKPVIYFTDLFKKAKTKLEAITIFLALLELIRLNEVLVKQDKEFGDIKILRNVKIVDTKKTETKPA
ncbi:MAG: segregation/condensation protein A [Candidatus Omnitrophica bacterium]|nr:segregation/condensation protein A [Candidatus Omnitrophota bacterium]